MSETIRIGVIGAGINTTLMHIPGFQAIDGVEVVSVANRSRESGQRVADQFGIPAVGDTWADVIDDPDVDAICIGTWPYMHRTLVLAALDAGKHVLTEARMAMNAAEAHEMLDASLDNPDLVAQVVPADFTFEVDQTIIDLIADGYLGDVVVADLAVHGGFMTRPTNATSLHMAQRQGHERLQHHAHGRHLRVLHALARPSNVCHGPDQELRSQAR